MCSSSKRANLDIDSASHELDERQHILAHKLASEFKQTRSKQLFADIYDNKPQNNVSKTNDVTHPNLSANDWAANNFEEVHISNCCCCACISNASRTKFKITFTVFNTFAFLFSFVNFGLGLWFRIDPKVYEIHFYIETQNYTLVGWILLFAGIWTCVLTFVGCLASWQNSSTMLKFYFITILLITILFICSIVLLCVYGFGSSLEQFLTKEIRNQILSRFHNIDSAQFMDFVQVKLQCCGARNYLDYYQLGSPPPISCYAYLGNHVSAPGCGKALQQLLDLRAGLAVAFLGGSVLTQTVTLALALVLILSQDKRKTNSRLRRCYQVENNIR